MNAANKVVGNIVRAALILALVAGIASVTQAQGPAAQSGAAAIGANRAEEKGSRATSPSQPQQGIKVHGDWTIVIRNEDGSVASRHEFKNALVPSLGGQLLLRVLRHDSSVGEWVISIQGTPGPCDRTVAAPGPGNCIFTQLSKTDTNQFPNLTLAIPQSGPDAGKLVLTGSAKAARVSQFTAVTTFIEECPASVAPANFCTGNFPQLTFTFQAIGSQNITVVANQTIDVTVVISFS